MSQLHLGVAGIAEKARLGRSGVRAMFEALAAVCADKSKWRRRKRGYAWRLARSFSSGILVSKAHASSMMANTCCTMLLGSCRPTIASAPTATIPT
jgi:hypothetical protein